MDKEILETQMQPEINAFAVAENSAVADWHTAQCGEFGHWSLRNAGIISQQHAPYPERTLLRPFYTTANGYEHGHILMHLPITGRQGNSRREEHSRW